MARDDVVVGFIGLGIMGGRMAANLQKAGYKLVVHDLQRQAASHHLNAGAAWADSPRALAGRSGYEVQTNRNDARLVRLEKRLSAPVASPTFDPLAA